MTDIFSSIIGSPVARRVGVPQPTRLRRFDPDRPLCDEPVLVAGSGEHADGLAAWLDARGIATLREPPSAAATSDDSDREPAGSAASSSTSATRANPVTSTPCASSARRRSRGSHATPGSS